MLRKKSDLEMMAAVLHDVVEDGAGWSLDRLATEGIPSNVVEAVDYLTKRPEEKGENYMVFIERASLNAIARSVKVADLEDNMDLSRIAHPVEKDFVRIEKYRRAHAFMLSPEVLKRSSEFARLDEARERRVADGAS
jgi:(p)ppGpp synthase/HD superfamily hydrolase